MCHNSFVSFCVLHWVVICYFYTIPSHAKSVFFVSCFKLIFSSAGKWLFLLRGEWRYYISHRRGFEPSPTLILTLYSGSSGFQMCFTSTEQDWTAVSAACLFFPAPEGWKTIYQLPEEHVSMCNIAWEFSFYYTLNCKVNLAGIRVKAVKHGNMKQIAHAVYVV